MKIDALDHLVLTVADVAETCAFYTRVLGMQEVTFGGGRKARGATSTSTVVVAFEALRVRHVEYQVVR